MIYYWMANENRMLMLLAYAKARRENLTREQERALARLIEQEVRGSGRG